MKTYETTIYSHEFPIDCGWRFFSPWKMSSSLKTPRTFPFGVRPSSSPLRGPRLSAASLRISEVLMDLEDLEDLEPLKWVRASDPDAGCCIQIVWIIVYPESGWWFGTWPWLLFFHILEIVTPTDFNIFQRDWNHQPVIIHMKYYNTLYIYIYHFGEFWFLYPVFFTSA